MLGSDPLLQVGPDQYFPRGAREGSLGFGTNHLAARVAKLEERVIALSHILRADVPLTDELLVQAGVDPLHEWSRQHLEASRRRIRAAARRRS